MMALDLRPAGGVQGRQAGEGRGAGRRMAKGGDQGGVRWRVGSRRREASRAEGDVRPRTRERGVRSRKGEGFLARSGFFCASVAG